MNYARQAPLSIRFSWQDYLSGLSFPPPEDLPDPGIGPEFEQAPGDGERQEAWHAAVHGVAKSQTQLSD